MTKIDIIAGRLERLEARVKDLEDRQDPAKYNCSHVWSIHKGTAGTTKICKLCGLEDTAVPVFF